MQLPAFTAEAALHRTTMHSGALATALEPPGILASGRRRPRLHRQGTMPL